MIDLIHQTAGTKGMPIKEWKVVFYVAPLGVYLDLDEAVKAASDLGLNPLLSVMPMSAAITQDEMEISYR